jgi:DNA repair exonuclease SbcCD ATPase subunit
VLIYSNRFTLQTASEMGFFREDSNKKALDEIRRLMLRSNPRLSEVPREKLPQEVKVLVKILGAIRDILSRQDTEIEEIFIKDLPEQIARLLLSYQNSLETQTQLDQENDELRSCLRLEKRIEDFEIISSERRKDLEQKAQRLDEALTTVEELKTQHQEHAAELKARQERMLEEHREEISNLIGSHRSEMEQLMFKHMSESQKAEAESSAKISQLDSTIMENKKKYKKTLDKVQHQKEKREEELVKEKQAATAELKQINATLQNRLLEREGYKGLTDLELRDGKELKGQNQVQGYTPFANRVEALAGIDWKSNRSFWPETALLKLNKTNEKRLKRRILGDLIWNLLFQHIFCSPFRVFGEEGQDLEANWLVKRERGML